MMQQCLPPGNPPARPLDLFERELPSLWHMHCKNDAGQWDAVGVFNFEDQPQERTVELAALGLPAGAEVVAFEFWEEKLLGAYKDRVTLAAAAADRPHRPDPSPAGPPAGDRHQHARAGRISRDQAAGLG